MLCRKAMCPRKLLLFLLLLFPSSNWPGPTHACFCPSWSFNRCTGRFAYFCNIAFVSLLLPPPLLFPARLSALPHVCHDLHCLGCASSSFFFCAQNGPVLTSCLCLSLSLPTTNLLPVPLFLLLSLSLHPPFPSLLFCHASYVNVACFASVWHLCGSIPSSPNSRVVLILCSY